MSGGVGHRCGSDLALLWLWYRLAAIAPIQPLGISICLGCGPKKTKKKKKNLYLFSAPRSIPHHLQNLYFKHPAYVFCRFFWFDFFFFSPFALGNFKHIPKWNTIMNSPEPITQPLQSSCVSSFSFVVYFFFQLYWNRMDIKRSINSRCLHNHLTYHTWHVYVMKWWPPISFVSIHSLL